MPKILSKLTIFVTISPKNLNFSSLEIPKFRTRYVSSAEIKHMLEWIGIKPSEEELDEMISLADTSGCGQVLLLQIINIHKIDEIFTF